MFRPGIKGEIVLWVGESFVGLFWFVGWWEGEVLYL
jgi:hypothetical protein